MRQWVLSIPLALRFLLVRRPQVMGKVLGIVYRTIASHLTHQAGLTRANAQTGAVTLTLTLANHAGQEHACRHTEVLRLVVGTTRLSALSSYRAICRQTT
jgi:hypothetical protein